MQNNLHEITLISLYLYRALLNPTNICDIILLNVIKIKERRKLQLIFNVTVNSNKFGLIKKKLYLIL